MSPREIASRVAQSGRISQDRRRYHRGNLYQPSPVEVKTVAPALVERARAILPGSMQGEWDALQSSEPKLAERVAQQARQRAAAILDGTIDLLGFPARLGGTIDWHRDPRTEYCDPRTEYRFPQKFYDDVQLYELPSGVDVKYVWEVGRHQWLADLARAWHVAGDVRAAAHARAVMLDWIDKNPYCEGIHWTSGLEATMRALAWLWTIALTGNASCWQAGDWPRVTQSLAQHAHFLERHFSFYTSPYNHLVGESAGLMIIGHWLGGISEAQRWLRVGREVLEQYGPRQFYEDGFSVEQAVGYHFYSLGFFFQAALVARQAGQPLTQVERILPKALRAGCELCQPNGRWPAIGDIDSARSIAVHVEDFWDFRSLCSLGAVLCGDGKAKATAQEPGEEIFWYLGTQGLHDWARLEAKSPANAAVLPDSGYVVARSNDQRDWLLFDVGPLGEGVFSDNVPSVSHGHADMLGVWLCWDGRPLLVDSGLPNYNGPRPEVDYFRSAAAHSTFEILEQPLARCVGRLTWAYVCRRPEGHAKLASDLWLARGRAHTLQGSVMERHILGIPGEAVWIADRIISSNPCHAAWYWQVAGTIDEAAPVAGASGLQYRLGSATITIQSDEPSLEAKREPAGDGPEGWQAPVYGRKVPGSRLVVRGKSATELLVLTCIGRNNAKASVTLGGARVGQAAHAEGMEQANPEVVWTVETSTGRRTIVAGRDLQMPAPFKPVTGIGDWPAFERVLP